MRTKADRFLPVVSNRGKAFNVRLVRKGDYFGADRDVVYDGEPLVEWYEPEYAEKSGYDRLGRFIRRDLARHLMASRETFESYGMRVAGEGQIFILDPGTVKTILDWIEGETK